MVISLMVIAYISLYPVFTTQKPPGVMCVLDDVCATMHAQGEGADMRRQR